LLRCHFANLVRLKVPKAPIPIQSSDPLKSHNTPFEGAQFLVINELDTVLSKWATGNIDEEIDIETDAAQNPRDEGVEVLSSLAKTIQEVITVTFPGIKYSSGVADALARVWEELRVFQSMANNNGDHTDVPPSLSRLLIATSRMGHGSRRKGAAIGDNSTSDGDDRMDDNMSEDVSMMGSEQGSDMSGVSDESDDATEAEKAGEKVIIFLQQMADRRRHDGPLAAEDVLSYSWATSVTRLFNEVKKTLKPFMSALENEIGIWTKRNDWSLSLVKECEAFLTKSKTKVLESVLSTVPSKSKGVAAEDPSAILEEMIGSGLDMTKLGRMPFVWAGASVCMSSQLLDEVTGRLPKVSKILS
jgi:hypothetical protein